MHSLVFHAISRNCGKHTTQPRGLIHPDSSKRVTEGRENGIKMGDSESYKIPNIEMIVCIFSVDYRNNHELIERAAQAVTLLLLGRSQDRIPARAPTILTFFVV